MDISPRLIFVVLASLFVPILLVRAGKDVMPSRPFADCCFVAKTKGLWGSPYCLDCKKHEAYRGIEAVGLHFLRVDLSGADLSGADFGGAHFFASDLSKANFTGAHFLGAVFSSDDASNRGPKSKKPYRGRTNLDGAIFVNADLRGADLYGVSVRGTDFTGADLTNADLRGAVVDGRTNIKDARSIVGIKLDDMAREPLGLDQLYCQKNAFCAKHCLPVSDPVMRYQCIRSLQACDQLSGDAAHPQDSRWCAVCVSGLVGQGRLLVPGWCRQMVAGCNKATRENERDTWLCKCQCPHVGTPDAAACMRRLASSPVPGADNEEQAMRHCQEVR